MLLMNVARLDTRWLPFLFFALFACIVIWIFRNGSIPSLQPVYMSVPQQRRLTLLVLLVVFLLAVARLPYLMEGFLHHLVGPIVYDDTWHLQEINSLVHSARYPAQCSLVPSRYFSLYYSPWMMIAALYLALPIHGFTIKAAFAIGCAIYQLLLCMTLFYVAISRAKSRQQLAWAIYLIAGWAGSGSLFSALYFLRRNIVWLRASETPIHLPPLLTGILWAPHHAASAVALILCWHLWDRAQAKDWRLIPQSSVLLAFAFYGSVFAFLGALPFAAYYIVRTFRANSKAIVMLCCLAAALIWPLLWIYLGKTYDVRFIVPFIKGIDDLFPYLATPEFISHYPKIASSFHRIHGMAGAFLVFLLLMFLNFLLHALALMLHGKKLSADNIAFASIAILFLVSTFFIGFPEGDNYASRGYLIPILVLGWICAQALPAIRRRLWIVAGLVLGSLGLMHDGFFVYRNAFRAARTPVNPTYGAAILAWNQDRDTSTLSRTALSDALKQNPDLVYQVEKFVDGGKTHLVVADRQLESLGPGGPWRWQQIPLPSNSSNSELQ